MGARWMGGSKTGECLCDLLARMCHDSEQLWAPKRCPPFHSLSSLLRRRYRTLARKNLRRKERMVGLDTDDPREIDAQSAILLASEDRIIGA